jgi:short-subunit dehydrogenase
MRRRQSGTIVNISSMDGIASLPVNGFYSSSKFAIEGITEALWQEIEPIGLRAFLVEPGSFRTGIEQRTRFSVLQNTVLYSDLLVADLNRGSRLKHREPTPRA